MKNRCKLFLCLLFCLNISFAQQKIIDSLENQLINPTNRMSNFKNLVDLAHQYEFINPKKGLKKLDKASKIIGINKESAEYGNFLSVKASCFNNLGKDSLAIVFYDKAHTLYKIYGTNKDVALNLLNKGLMYRSKGKYDESNTMNQEALRLYIKEKDTTQMLVCYERLAHTDTETGNYSSAMNTFLNAESLYKFLKKEESLAYANLQSNIATLYQRLYKPKEALNRHSKALEIFRKNEHKYLTAVCYHNIGAIYQEEKEILIAINNYKESLKIGKEINNSLLIAANLGGLGAGYLDMENINLATKYLDSSISMNKKNKNYYLLSINYNNKAELYTKEKKFLKSKKILSEAIEYATIIGDKRILVSLKNLMSKVFSELGDYKTAFKYSEETRILKDSLLTDDKKEEIAVLKAQYDFDKEKETINANFEKEQILQKAKLDRQVFIRNVSIVSGLFLVLILILGFVLWRKKQQADYNAQLSTSKLQSLRAQMNPHFIFNSLNSINDYVLKNEKQNASNYLAQFSNMVRKILENTEEEEVSLEDEINFLKNYVALEQKRLKQNFTFNVVVAQDLEPELTFLAPSLLQPFIENSIWHGLSSIENGVLLLTFKRDDQNLICIVEDNGKGLNEGKLENPLRKSFGLENVKTRLELLNKTTKSSAKFKISNKENSGVKVVVTLPLLVENFKKND